MGSDKKYQTDAHCLAQSEYWHARAAMRKMKRDGRAHPPYEHRRLSHLWNTAVMRAKAYDDVLQSRGLLPMNDQPLSEDYAAPDVPLAADGSRADLPEGAVMQNGMKNQSSSAGRFYGRSVIHGKDGEHNTPYMTRYWIGRLRLHIFYRGDQDPDPHDHPWGFWTFPLTSYVEEVTVPIPLFSSSQSGTHYSTRRFETHRQVVRAFWPHYRPATHTHRVLGRARVQGFNADWSLGHVVGEGRIVTIVWRGKDERKWGFLKNRDGRWCWVAWRDYVFANGKSAPCE